MKKYYTLLIKCESGWVMESGHYSKADCKADKECFFDRKTKIICTEDNDKAILAKIAELNAKIPKTESEVVKIKLNDVLDSCSFAEGDKRKLFGEVFDAMNSINRNTKKITIKKVLENLLDDCAHVQDIYSAVSEIYQSLEA